MRGETGLGVGISEQLQQLFDRAPGLVVVLRGPDHVLEYANQTYLDLMGWSCLEARPLRQAAPELVEQGFIGLLDEVYCSGKAFEGREIPILLKGAGDRPREGYFDFVYQPIIGADGGVEGIFAQGSDVTARVRAERGLRASEGRFADIFNQATVGIAQTDLTGRFVLINDRICEILGRPRATLLNMRMQDVTHPNDLPANLPLFEKLVRTGEPFVLEKRYIRADGAFVWVRNSVALQRDGRGDPEYVTAVVVDVTDAKLAEARQQLLINELNHRVKNTLATVQSLAVQTLRNAKGGEAHAAFLDRLMALSRAHDVLTDQQWRGADLHAVVFAALQPFGGDQLERFTLEGPQVRLAPQVSLGLSLALHELATNAVKHGALKASAGHVTIRWSCAADCGSSAFDLTWRESGGPRVEAPARQGFGSRLLTSLTRELGGSVTGDFPASGVVWTISARPALN